MILILGILGWMVCPFLGIAAWMMGNTDLAEMRAGRMDRSGEGLTQIGKIIGMIAVILNLIAVLIMVLLFALGGAAFFMAAPVQNKAGGLPPVRIEQNMPK